MKHASIAASSGACLALMKPIVFLDGHDFRPGYRQLKLLKEHFPQTPLIAMTATVIPYLYTKGYFNSVKVSQSKGI